MAGLQNSQWYAAYTRHQHEKTVTAAVEGKGIESFLPVYPERSKWADRIKVVYRPLFPCYVFLRTDLKRRGVILETPGIHFLVGDSNGPISIPELEIDAIRRVLANRLLIEPHPFLTIGDRVRVKSGPLEGIEGLLVRKKNDERIILSVEMLQKSVAVELNGYLVERIDGRPQPR